MERKLIFRGLLAGLVAGAIVFVFARIFVEPQIALAIDYESGRDAAQQVLDQAAGRPLTPEHADPFSRAVQANVGIGVGLILMGLALGGLYAVAFTIAYGRVGAVRARPLALLVALGAFVCLYLVPFLKYPANPPAIGHESTIGVRTALYLALVGSSLLCGILAVVLGRRLSRRFSVWRSVLVAGAAYAVVMGVLMGLLPSLGELASNVADYGRQTSETPLPLRDPTGAIVFPGFDADVLYRFRLYAIAVQAILWAAIGLVFGPLAERVLAPVTQRVASTQSPQKTGADPATR